MVRCVTGLVGFGGLLNNYAPRIWISKRFRTKKPKRSFESNKIEVSLMPNYQFAPDAPDKLKVHDRIFMCGLAATGALGFPGLVDPEVKKQRDYWLGPRKMRFFHMFKVRDVACGYGFTVISATNSQCEYKLWGTGLNTNFQLGLQQVGGSPEPLVMIYNPAPINLLGVEKSTIFKQVACGRCHTILLSEKNEAYGLGSNAMGQCGRPIVENEIPGCLPQMNKIEGIDGIIKQIICGQDHTLFLTENGQVYACGFGADGQLGLGHFNNIGIPERVKGDIENENIVDISSSVDGVLACNDRGDLFGWGNSEYSQFALVSNDFQLNIPRRIPISVGKVIKVAAGGTLCGFINDKGQVYVWGFGILGQGPQIDCLKVPSLLPEPLFGGNEVNPDVTVTQLYAGVNHWAAVNSRGDLYTWGKNRYGALGFKDVNDRFMPFRVNLPVTVKKVSLGPDHTAIIGRTLI